MHSNDDVRIQVGMLATPNGALNCIKQLVADVKQPKCHNPAQDATQIIEWDATINTNDVVLVLGITPCCNNYDDKTVCFDLLTQDGIIRHAPYCDRTWLMPLDS